MKEVVLKKTKHNGIDCYKDETKVFMVIKEYGTRYWRVNYAKTDNEPIINELGCWGYNNFTKVKTLKQAIEEIEYLLTRPIFNEFQTKLLNDVYGYERFGC